MKETVLDVLMYLFECFVDSEDEPEPDRKELREELERAGFRDREIDRALDWLDGLNLAELAADGPAPRSATIRLYDRLEQERLDPQCRGYMLHLEQIGILSATQREVVIDRLMALDQATIERFLRLARAKQQMLARRETGSMQPVTVFVDANWLTIEEQDARRIVNLDDATLHTEFVRGIVDEVTDDVGDSSLPALPLVRFVVSPGATVTHHRLQRLLSNAQSRNHDQNDEDSDNIGNDVQERIGPGLQSA